MFETIGIGCGDPGDHRRLLEQRRNNTVKASIQWNPLLHCLTQHLYYRSGVKKKTQNDDKKKLG